MSEKYLGKIIRVEFGIVKDYPFLFGITYEFSYSCWNVCGHDVVNTDLDNCCWNVCGHDVVNTDLDNSEIELGRMLKGVLNTMKDAKVNDIYELTGKPVELIINDGQFKSFRILKEVI
ncbi:MAG TPA: hypothetical protein PLV67_05730 [Methanofastidiosum sp.]|nr:hypothetical protein [Methanofastidiosum sp.]